MDIFKLYNESTSKAKVVATPVWTKHSACSKLTLSKMFLQIYCCFKLFLQGSLEGIKALRIGTICSCTSSASKVGPQQSYRWSNFDALYLQWRENVFELAADIFTFSNLVLTNSFSPQKIAKNDYFNEKFKKYGADKSHVGICSHAPEMERHKN